MRKATMARLTVYIREDYWNWVLSIKAKYKVPWWVFLVLGAYELERRKGVINNFRQGGGHE